MKKVLLIGKYHQYNDPRLCYRQMRILLDNEPNLKVYFLDWTKEYEDEKFSIVEKENENNQIKFKRIVCVGPYYRFSESLLDRFVLNRIQTKHLIWYAKKISPDTIQASHALELRIALKIKQETKARLIYDAHEDYYLQALEYRNRSIKGRLKGIWARMTEILLVRRFDAVFSTDDFLLQNYRKKIYKAKKVSLLRNFPYKVADNKIIFSPKNVLNLIYIGGFNKYRGIIECAYYCKRFNEERTDYKLKFTVYVPSNQDLDSLANKGLIIKKDWIDYDELMTKLKDYDVGVCLLMPIVKYKRNLPVKNFDYMAVGLPILTSNFDNVKKYIDISNAGITIDPLSYGDFKDAVTRLFDPEVRREYSENGKKWSRQTGNFITEAKEYVECILGN